MLAGMGSRGLTLEQLQFWLDMVMPGLDDSPIPGSQGKTEPHASWELQETGSMVDSRRTFCTGFQPPQRARRRPISSQPSTTAGGRQPSSHWHIL